jgi:hypothetical protein
MEPPTVMRRGVREGLKGKKGSSSPGVALLVPFRRPDPSSS